MRARFYSKTRVFNENTVLGLNRTFKNIPSCVLFRSDILRSILKWIQNTKTKKFTHKNKTYAGAQVNNGNYFLRLLMNEKIALCVKVQKYKYIWSF